jgi:hypothetical protein
MQLRINWTYKNKYVETTLPLKDITGPHGTFQYYPVVHLDNKLLNDVDIQMLSIMLKFESIEQFFECYNEDFNGIIN